MLKQSDIKGRLNLFRYGILVVTIVAFITSWMAPVVLTAQLGDFALGIGEAFMPALIIAVITAVIGIVSYFVYAQILERTIGQKSNEEAA